MKWDKNKHRYVLSKKLKNGQTAVLIFNECMRNVLFESYLYTVGYGVGKSRKQVLDWYEGENFFLSDKVNGKESSIEGLFWAKKEILNFVSHRKHAFIEITGSDKRRYNAYKRALLGKGFEQGYQDALIRSCGKTDAIWGDEGWAYREDVNAVAKKYDNGEWRSY